jgi:hypothetical protein
VLESVVNPRSGTGVVSAGMIADLEIDESGTASFVFLLRRNDPATLVRQVRQAFAAAELANPRIKVVDPDGAVAPTHGPPKSAQAGVPAAPTPNAVPERGLTTDSSTAMVRSFISDTTASVLY